MTALRFHHSHLSLERSRRPSESKLHRPGHSQPRPSSPRRSPALIAGPHLLPLLSATMLLSSLLLAALLPALTFATNTDKWRAAAKRQGGLLTLDAAQYDELVAQPRDYSVSIVLTALGAQYKCVPCGCVHFSLDLGWKES